MEFKKEWKSYQEQVDILESRGLMIDNREKALEYLNRIGYYRLSGYWYPFRKLIGGSKRDDDFIENSYFHDAIKLYVFDKRLRLLALDAIERIELAIRVDIAHRLGEKDIFAYENPDLFHGSFSKHVNNKSRMTKHQEWLRRFDRQVRRAGQEPFIKHYNEKYSGKYPIWVVIEIWDFGLLSHLFAGLKEADQNEIAKCYDINNGKLFSKWVRSLNFIRNVSAHHSRLWNTNIVDRSPLRSLEPYWSSLDNSRAFYYFCIMQKLLKSICPNSSWRTRFIELMDSFPKLENNAVSLENFGIIEGWKEWDLWSV